jgi:fatty-acyl-CoA synthase
MFLLKALYKTGLLNWKKIRSLYKAKQKHGNNSCMLLCHAADFYANNIALADGQQRLTYLQLYQQALQTSAIIEKKVNLTNTSTVIFIFENKIAHIIVLYALQCTGTSTLLLHAKTDINTIQSLQQEQNAILIADKKINKATLLPAELINEIDVYKKIFIRKVNAAVIFSTSGTTGKAKLIKKRNGLFYWLQSFTHLLTYTGIHQHPSVFIGVPLAHGFGYTALLFAMVLGKKAVLNNNLHWEEQATLIKKEQAAILAGVPASLYYLAQQLEGENPVKLVISGGAPLTTTIFTSLQKSFGKNIFSMYGSTEASTSFIANCNELQKHINALGKPLKGVNYFLDADTGELIVNSPLANTPDKDGWVNTGDIVKYEKGLLIWCGRKDDMIIKGGVNIYPTEIEAALLKINGIEEVFVCGEKHSIKGQTIKAYIKKSAAALVTEEDIKLALRHNLSTIKIPDSIIWTDSFHYTATGKKIKPAI